MKPYTSGSASPTFQAVYALLLAELTNRTEDREEQKRAFDLLMHALHLWSDHYTESIEREIGLLLLARVSEAQLVRELAYVLHHRASPASERILLEAIRRAHEGGHGVALVELMCEVVDWIGDREALLDVWVEQAIVAGFAGNDDESTALLASRYLRVRPARASWLEALLRDKPAVSHALCAEISLLFLSPTVEGMLDWSLRADSVDDDELPTHAPWLDVHALDCAMVRAHPRGNDEQRAAIDEWREWLRRDHGTQMRAGSASARQRSPRVQ